MNRNQIFITTIAILLSVFSLTSHSAPYNIKASQKALDLIESLSLQEGGKSLREHPRWKRPEYIVAFVPSILKATAKPMIAELEKVADGVEIKVFSPKSATDFPDYVKQAQVLIGPCYKALLDKMPNLIWIQTPSSGSESCTSQSGVEPGDFTLTNIRRIAGVPIAEHAISLTLMLNRNLHLFHHNQMKSKWQRQLAINSGPGELSEKTMLVLGLGGIGSEVAKRANALGMRVIATRNSSRTGPDYVAKVGLSSEMLELAKEADFVVNTLPLTPATTNLIDKHFFAALKPGGYYISVGRGQTTKLDDLMAALNSKQLAGAGLDVMHPEPLPPEHPLWKMENVVITPHIAGYSKAAVGRSFILFQENLRRYMNGEKLLNVVDIKRGY